MKNRRFFLMLLDKAGPVRVTAFAKTPTAQFAGGLASPNQVNFLIITALLVRDLRNPVHDWPGAIADPVNRFLDRQRFHPG